MGALLPPAAAIAARLRGSAFRNEIAQLAARIREHQVPVFGQYIHLGPEIQWTADPHTGVSAAPVYFRRIPYLDPSASGDHKLIWEINRHQFLVVLAQDALLNGNTDSLAHLGRHLESWFAANPFQRGMNWTSALEVAFRALSWIWIWHLAGDRLSPELSRRLYTGLYQHGHHLAANLSRYFAANTHLLGEAVALHALGALFPAFPQAARWRETGGAIVRHEIRRQVHRDGAHFEHSTYYHVYALDMFLFHAILSAPDAEYKSILERMGVLLNSLMGRQRRLAYFGDDDGGRLFHPYGPADEFGRATLATLGLYLGVDDFAFTEPDTWPQAAWWLPASPRHSSRGLPRTSRGFPDCGLYVIESAHAQVIFDAGPFGWIGAHSHADALSFVLTVNGLEVLIDPGTFTYVQDPAARSEFRSTAAHNTITIDGRGQAEPGPSPFTWSEPPRVRLLDWLPECGAVAAECAFGEFVHRRRLTMQGPRLLVEDEISGCGRHEVAQHWHCASDDAARRLHIEAPVEQHPGWRSRVHSQKEPAGPVLVRRETIQLPARWHTEIDIL